jgi:poly(A) polymerase
MYIFEFLSKFESYLVGGAIRDFFLGKKITDIDIVIIEDLENFKKIIKSLSRSFIIFPLDKERNIYRVTINGKTIDLTNSENLFEDLKKRDFTINALAIKLSDCNIIEKKDFFKLKINKKKLIDNFNSVYDINKKNLKTISKDSIKEDPLRILRAFRFFTIDSFKINLNLKKEIIENKSLLVNVSKERIREELIKIFKSDKVYETIKKMIETEVIFEIFPELKKQIGCAKVYYGKNGVISHTLKVLKRLDMFFENPKLYLDIPKQIEEKIEKEKYLIKLSGLLHDIAKPHTARIIDNRLRFFGHEEKGGEISEKYLREYRFSNDEIKYIKTIISSHLRIGNIAHNDNVTNKAILRIFYDLKEYALGLIILSWADYSSHISEKKLITIREKIKEKPFQIKRQLPKSGFRKTLRFLQVVNMIIKHYTDYEKKANIKPIVDGYTVMEILKIPPSKLVGNILKKLINLQLEGKIKTKDEAINYIKSLKIKKLEISK